MNNLKKFDTYANLTIYQLQNFISPHVFYDKTTERIHYYMKEYQLLDYISSTETGGQYIDLGCKLMENTDDIHIDMKFNFKGHGKDGLQQSTFICAQPEKSPYPGFVCRTGKFDTEKIPNTAIEFKFKWELNNMSTFYDDGGGYPGYFFNDWGPMPSQGTITSHTKHFINNVYEESIIIDNIPQEQCHNMNLHLFCALNSSNQPYRFSEIDVYYMRIYKGGTLLRSLWPVRRKSDNAIGLYDIITDHFYTSQGDEPFIAPKYISLPSSYTPLEYIASTSTGGQYIDLNLQMWTTSPSKYELNLITNLIGNGASSSVNDSNNNNLATVFSCNKEVSPYPGFVIRANELGSETYTNVYQNRIPETIFSSKNNILNIHQSGTYSDEIHDCSTYLFCGVNENNIPWRFAEARIYYCKIIINDILVRELIPCKNNQNVCGLYDLVNNVFYTSQGDEPFIGQEINSN